MTDELIKRIAEETADAVHDVYRPILRAKDAEIARLRRLNEATGGERVHQLNDELDEAYARIDELNRELADSVAA
jgi:polyhydroxyalkanoate synthesis regulator phasin